MRLDADDRRLAKALALLESDKLKWCVIVCGDKLDLAGLDYINMAWLLALLENSFTCGVFNFFK